MAKIAVPMPEHDITCDVQQNPMLVLMQREDDAEEGDFDIAESEWLAGKAVTAPKHNQD